MTNGAIAIFSSPVIWSFGFSGSFSLTSVTPAAAASGRSAARTAAEKRFTEHLPVVSKPAAAWAAEPAAQAADDRSASVPEEQPLPAAEFRRPWGGPAGLN